MDAVTLGEFLAEFYKENIDEPLSRVGDVKGPFPAGAPAIFAYTLAKLGDTCGFISMIGKDDFGKVATKRFEKGGVDISYLIEKENYTTGTSFVAYFKDGSRKFLFHLNHAAAGQLSPESIEKQYVSKADVLHIAGSTLSINESCREAIHKAIEIADDKDLKITYDPNLRPELLEEKSIREVSEPIIEVCDFLLPNKKEIRNLTGKEELSACAEEFLEYPIEAVIIKREEEGTIMYSQNKKVNVPSFSVEKVDPTGAGDSFDAGFVHGLLNGKPIEEAIRFGNAAGALAVTVRGGMEGIENREEVTNLIETQS